MLRKLLLPVLLAAVVLIGGCARGDAGNQGAESGHPVPVVATTSMIADLVRTIGGDHVAVQGLMGPGVDPHLYKASEGDVARMAGAAVVFYNGLHLEGRMTEVFDQMGSLGKATVALAEVSVPDSLLLESSSFTGNYDPHVWFSVPLWGLVADRVAVELGRLDPDHAEVFVERAGAYRQTLQETHEYVQERVASVPEESRVLITSHDAFGYFGRTYGFDVRGLQGLSTATEAGTSDVQELAAFVAERRIPAIFIETSVPVRGIEAVREAVRARGFDVRIGGTLYGDALGGTGSGADTYVGMVRTNVDTIVEGLAANPSS